MENYKKGLVYEIQIRDYIINNLHKQAFLWKDTPESFLINNGIILNHNQNRLLRYENKVNKIHDTGIDVIQIEDNNKCSLIQCKNGYKNGLTYSELCGFFAWMASLDNLQGYVYYTNKLSYAVQTLPKNKRIEYIKIIYDEVKEEIKEENKKKFIPYDYQLKVKEIFDQYFIKNDRGILSMPCGTGKTYASYLISEKYDQIIIISPLKQFAKQNIEKYIEYGYNKSNTLLVDSDGDRDIKSIEKFIKTYKKFLISSTFCSVDVIHECLKFCNKPLIIIDEFHNISKTNITSEDDFNKILYSEHRILFMSATPRVYELEDENEGEYEDEDIKTEDIFGKVVYNMNFTTAIEKKYITDYRIWFPSLHENNDKLNNELSIYNIDAVIKSKCNYLFSCLLNNGNKKCIIYCIDNIEINNMIEAITKLNEYYILDCEYQKITAENTERQRINILNKFTNSYKRQLLFSIRILDECIDIPACDSIYITYPSKSKIRTIQRISRCLRIDKNNEFKIGNIFIWCDEYDKILDILSSIKEYDIFFKDKIKINKNDFYGDNDIKDIELDKDLINNYILDIQEYKVKSWKEKLLEVERYMDEYDKRPSMTDKNNYIKTIGSWITQQLQNYKKNQGYIMLEKNKILWEKFIKKYDKYLFKDDSWYSTLKDLKNYINENNKKPNKRDKNDKIAYLGAWLCSQNHNFSKKIKIMSNEDIRKEFEKFKKEYIKYFDIQEDIWFDTLEEIINYIDINKKRPTESKIKIENLTKEEIIEIKNCNKLKKWLDHQINNYKKNIHNMAINKNIKEAWEDFISKYKEYFITDEDKWLNFFKMCDEYITKNNKKPSTIDINIDVKQMGNWVSSQQQNYRKNIKSMLNSDFKIKWENLVKKHNKYFKETKNV